jgi:pimeloyl-ACP methyl ester carboxylesterase
VVAYDRSGLGHSPPGRQAPDAETRARELRELIEAIGLAGPVVLIGHSIAALYLRVYVHRYPDDVAAVVFLDSTHALVYRLFKGHTPLRERFGAAFASCAHHLGVKSLPFPLIRASDAPWSTLPEQARCQIEQLSTRTDLLVTERAERAMLEAASRQAQACGNLGAIPLLVITGGTRTEEELRFAEEPESFMDKWMLLQRDLVSLSESGRHVVIEGAGHRNLVTEKGFADRVCEKIAGFVKDTRGMGD